MSENIAKQHKQSTHPKGFYIIFFSQMFTTFGFFTCNALIALFASNALHFSDQNAYALAAANTALLFTSQLLGGFLSGRYLGYKNGFYLGCIAVFFGFLLLVTHQGILLYLGLTLITLGFGLIVPSITCLLSQLYVPGDYRRDSGFTLSYAGYNIGSFAAFLGSGIIVRVFSYGAAFALSSISIIVSLLIFVMNRHRYEKCVVSRQIAHASTNTFSGYGKTIVILLIAGCLVLSILKYAYIANYFLMGLGVCAAILVFTIAMTCKKHERNKLLAFLVLTFFSVAFWSLYMVSINCLPIFSERNVNRHIFDWVLPAASVGSLNALVVILLGSYLSTVWRKLDRIGKSPSYPAKFSYAIMQMGIGYLILAVGIHYANQLGYVALYWVALSYVFQTSGELFIAPIGNSMVGHLVPKRYEGLMFGIWAFSTGVSSAVSGFLGQTLAANTGSHSPLVTNAMYSHAFSKFGLITLCVGILLFLLIPQIKKLMGEKNNHDKLPTKEETHQQQVVAEN